MKKLKNILVFVFLIGMVFTFFQFLPLNEELAQKTEFLKKSDSNESDNDSESDSEETDSKGDNESNQEICCIVSFNLSNYYNTLQRSYHSELNYNCSLSNINTPPPEFKA